MNQLLSILTHPRVTSRVRRFVAVGGTLLAAKIQDPGLQVAALAIMTEVLEVWAMFEDQKVASNAVTSAVSAAASVLAPDRHPQEPTA